MSLKWPAKDEDEVLDYSLNWFARLAGDTIATSTWFLPVGVTLVHDSDLIRTGGPTNEPTEWDQPDSATVIWLSAGTNGEHYALLNRIVTAGGRTMDQTVKLPMKAK